MAAILLGTGVVATVAGLMMGATFRDSEFGLMDIGADGFTVLSGTNLPALPTPPVTAPDAPTAPAKPAKPGVASAGSGDYSYTINESYDAQVQKITVNVGPGEVIIEEGNSFSIVADGDRAVEYRSYLQTSGGVNEWVVETRMDKKINLRGVDAKLRITVPKDWVADSWSVELGMGELDAEAIRGGSVELVVGMGSMDIDLLESTNTDLTCDMGQMTIDNAVLTGATNMECGMGQIDMTIDGNENDFGGKFSVGMGNVQVGNRSAGGMGGSLEFNADSANQLTGDCGMGQIDIDFTK